MDKWARTFAQHFMISRKESIAKANRSLGGKEHARSLANENVEDEEKSRHNEQTLVIETIEYVEAKQNSL